jgi:tripartite ATP-independent transporter DctM subunit
MSTTMRAGRLGRLEDSISIAVLGAMTLLPVVEVAGRAFVGRGLAGSIPLVQHLTLWIALLGAALAARSDRLLALSTTMLLSDRLRAAARVLTGVVGAAVVAGLFFASLELVKVEREVGGNVALGIRLWWVLCILPAGFALVGSRLIWRSSTGWPGRVGAVSGIVITALLGWFPSLQGTTEVLVVGSLVLAAATVLGLPIFAAIGGLALLFFWNEGIPVASVPEETYRLAANPMLPAVPLFTLAGYVLSEGGASRRLLRLLTAVVGWMPGGLAIATTLLLAMFTPLTGASGVTILCMGGLLLPVLVRARYPEQFSIGLVTVSGSIGLLLPPSLPVILYGVTSQLSIVDLFIGGLLPGLLLIAGVAAWGVRAELITRTVRTPFRLREAAAASWRAKWEILLPVAVLASYFGGYATLVEASALAVVFAIFTECFVHKELSLTRDIPRIAVECATLTGGFLIILAVALGLTNYLVLAEVPMRALELVRTYIDSPLVFLLVLNLFLLIVGGLMDIYSAIFVVVPLIAPIGVAYGIDPVHLAIIFLANLELGYLTPPMGENLFLSAYRFKQPLTTLFRSTLPLWVILLIGVLIITYVPALTLGPLSLFAD